MSNANFVILYVESPEASARLYSDLLHKSPIEASPNFVMFALKSDVMLGLWSKHTVKPGATAVGGSELAFTVADEQTVHAWHDDWVKRGVPVVQVPTRLDFGFTFVASDLDGHRLRVFAPA